jgi:hypothetical protein
MPGKYNSIELSKMKNNHGRIDNKKLRCAIDAITSATMEGIFCTMKEKEKRKYEK